MTNGCWTQALNIQWTTGTHNIGSLWGWFLLKSSYSWYGAGTAVDVSAANRFAAFRFLNIFADYHHLFMHSGSVVCESESVESMHCQFNVYNKTAYYCSFCMEAIYDVETTPVNAENTINIKSSVLTLLLNRGPKMKSDSNKY